MQAMQRAVQSGHGKHMDSWIYPPSEYDRLSQSIFTLHTCGRAKQGAKQADERWETKLNAHLAVEKLPRHNGKVNSRSNAMQEWVGCDESQPLNRRLELGGRMRASLPMQRPIGGFAKRVICREMRSWTCGEAGDGCRNEA